MLNTTELFEDTRPARSKERAPVVTTRRVRLAQVLALVALVAALIGALSPADRIRTTYTWPPEELPSGTPGRLWYTPLLLIRRTPESVSARIPCSVPRALPASAGPVTVLATARFPERNRGLAVTQSNGRLLVRVGEQALTSVSAAAAPSSKECAFVLGIAGGRWSLEGGPDEVALSGALEAMPVVNGLFSALDLRSGTGTPPSIAVTTAVNDSQASVLQAVAWTVAVIGAVTALLLVAVEGRRRPLWRGFAAAVTSVRTRLRAVDAVVAAVLLVWWVISPVSYDDGWVATRTANYAASGGFSAYFNAFGANHPLGYWLEWLQHWLTESTNVLLVLRVPALLCLAAIWVLCRWILTRILAGAAVHQRIPHWALASAFAVGAMSWGMTLRPEPFVALLVTGVVACTVRFLERETVASLALAGVLIALAIPAHPAGIVSLAPILVAAPRLIRWARPRPAVAATIFLAAGALLVFFMLVGSDLELWNADTQTHRTYGDASRNWREEVQRYAQLFESPIFANPIRHTSVALMTLAVAAYLLRRRRSGSFLLDFPSITLIVSLVLLVATPSKRPWHFGTMLGIVAVAVAAEIARIRLEERRPDRWRVFPFFVVGIAVLAATWLWSPRGPWNNLDLQSLDWILGFERRISLATLAGVLPLLLFGVAGFVELARNRSGGLQEAPWRVASWTAAALAVPVIAFTTAVLVADAAKTDSWTLTRQNLETLGRDLRCGLADDGLVPSLSSMRSLARAGAGDGRRAPAWVPPPPVEGLPRFAVGPSGGGSAASPWFELPRAQPFGVFVSGSHELTEGLRLEWGQRRRGRIERLGTDQLRREADVIVEVRPDLVTWRFLSSQELPSPEPGASAVRFLLPSGVPPGSSLAVTGPIAYTSEPLARRLARTSRPSLLMSNMSMYVPCARQPRLDGGVVEVPSEIVAFLYAWPVGLPQSPFSGLLDLYQLRRLPLADAKGTLHGSVVYDIDRRVPGALTAAPDRTTG